MGNPRPSIVTELPSSRLGAIDTGMRVRAGILNVRPQHDDLVQELSSKRTLACWRRGLSVAAPNSDDGGDGNISDDSVSSGQHGYIESMLPEEFFRTFRFALKLQNMEEAQISLEEALDIFFDDNSNQDILDKWGHTIPNRRSFEKGVARLDAACCLIQRQEIHRFLDSDIFIAGKIFCDASPISGR